MSVARIDPQADLTEAWCGNCHAEVMVRADRRCPACGRLAQTTTTLATAGDTQPPLTLTPKDLPKQQAEQVQPARSVVLPRIREAVRLDAALDGVVAALERDELAAKAEFEAARERYRTVRQAAAEMRAMRGMVKIEPAEIAGGGSAAEASPAALGEKRWARDFDACTNCEKTDSPHQGKGECARCGQYRRAHGHARPKSLDGRVS